MIHLFYCSGCGLSTTVEAICLNCIERIKRNTVLLDSPSANIVAIAPLLYSISTTHSLLKYWKNRRGLILEKTLLKIDPKLLEALSSLKFDVVLPVPQSNTRSWMRGHATAFTVAQYFSTVLNVPIKKLADVEEYSVRQSSLQAADRSLEPNPFFINQKIQEYKTILIVDDLITTGSTLTKLSDRLLEANPKLKLYAASLGFRPTRSSNTELGNESPDDLTAWIQERDFYSRFQYRI